MASLPPLDSTPTGRFAFILEKLRNQTPEETFQSLVRAGIYTESGELTDHYKPKPRRKSRKKDDHPSEK